MRRMWEVELSVLIESSMRLLSEREQQVLRMRYGLNDGECYSMKQVAEYLHLTRERVRQIENVALANIRGHYAGKNPFTSIMAEHNIEVGHILLAKELA